MGNSKNNNFGYIGQELPTINAAGTSGIFNNADINYLKSRDEYPGVILVDFLVIAGGAGGYGGGGGAGGYRNSYAGETSGGNNIGGEGALAIAPNQVLTVELGSGGAAKFSGNDSTFGSIVSDGGGRGGPTNQNGTALCYFAGRWTAYQEDRFRGTYRFFIGGNRWLWLCWKHG